MRGVVLGLLLIALWWGWRKFRYGGVVIEGSGAKKEVEVGEAVKSLSSRRGRRQAMRQLMSGKMPELGE